MYPSHIQKINNYFYLYKELSRLLYSHIQLDPTTVWLREEFGNRFFFPDSANASFDLPAGIDCLVVEGAAVVQGPSPVSSVPVTTPGYAGGTRPVFSSGQRKGQPTFNVKVVQASLKWLPNGKPEFNHLGQVFVDITEATANVHYIRSEVQKKWGADYIIVTADGLQLDDSPGTQGMALLVDSKDWGCL